MRFECHVDSNPVTGLLFFHRSPGGRAANSFSGTIPAAVGVEAAGTGLHGSSGRAAGQLIVFDGKTYPHYARPLRSDVGRASRGGHELLHRVVPGIDPPAAS